MAVSSAFSVAISSSLGLLFAAGLVSPFSAASASAGVPIAVDPSGLVNGREQPERPLEGGEILAHLLLHRLEGGGAEGVGESAADIAPAGG